VRPGRRPPLPRRRAGAPGLAVEQLLDSPFVLLARGAEAAVDELRRRQQLDGFESFTTHQPSLEALGEAITAYRFASSH